MPKFRSKPVEIEAFQLKRDNFSEACDFMVEHGAPADYPFHAIVEEENENIQIKVTTTHGEQAFVRNDDWIIPDSKPGTFYPCKPDVFAEKYEEIN